LIQSTKSGRKSRRAHLPVSAVWGHERDFQFKPQDEDWGRIEGVYPFLKIEDREPIARLVAEYLRHDSYERYAPFLNDGMGWLDRTEEATKAFHRAITELPSSPEQLGALYAARSLVERRIQHRALPDGLEWHTLQGIMLHVMAAFDAAKSSLPTQAVGGFVEGQAWTCGFGSCPISPNRRAILRGPPKALTNPNPTSHPISSLSFVSCKIRFRKSVGGTLLATRHLHGQSRKPGANARELNSTKLAGESPALVLKTRVRVVAVIAT
jgi:hypothetical protein